MLSPLHTNTNFIFTTILEGTLAIVNQPRMMIRHCCARGLPLATRTACHPRKTPSCPPLRASSSETTPPDVQKLAQLAHISITSEEAQDWQGKISNVFEWFAQLQAVDVEGIPPATRPSFGNGPDAGVVLRPDEVHSYQHAASILEQAPARDGAFVKVPRIATGADTGVEG